MSLTWLLCCFIEPVTESASAKNHQESSYNNSCDPFKGAQTPQHLNPFDEPEPCGIIKDSHWSPEARNWSSGRMLEIWDWFDQTSSNLPLFTHCCTMSLCVYCVLALGYFTYIHFIPIPNLSHPASLVIQWWFRVIQLQNSFCFCFIKLGVDSRDSYIANTESLSSNLKPFLLLL